jgi:hypothetical protein
MGWPGSGQDCTSAVLRVPPRLILILFLYGLLVGTIKARSTMWMEHLAGVRGPPFLISRMIR